MVGYSLAMIHVESALAVRLDNKMNIRFTPVMIAGLAVVGLASVGWFGCATDSTDNARRCLKVISARSAADMATLKGVCGVQPTNTDRENAQSLHELTKDTPVSDIASSFEKARKELIAAKPTQNRKKQLQSFEQEHNKLTQALDEEVNSRITALSNMAAAGGVAAASLGVLSLLLYYRQPSGSGRSNSSTDREKLKDLERVMLPHLRAVTFKMDEQLLFCEVNSSARLLWGYDPEELTTTPATDFFKLSEARFRTLIAAAKSQQIEQAINCQVRTKSGRLIPTQLLIAQGSTRHFSCIAVEAAAE